MIGGVYVDVEATDNSGKIIITLRKQDLASILILISWHGTKNRYLKQPKTELWFPNKHTSGSKGPTNARDFSYEIESWRPATSKPPTLPPDRFFKSPKKPTNPSVCLSSQGMSVLQCVSVAMKATMRHLENGQASHRSRLHALRQEQMMETLECLLLMGSYLHTMVNPQ